MFWVLKRTDGSFEYPQHMFWLKNKKNEFLLCRLNWRPKNVIICLSVALAVYDYRLLEIPYWGVFGESCFSMM